MTNPVIIYHDFVSEIRQWECNASMPDEKYVVNDNNSLRQSDKSGSGWEWLEWQHTKGRKWESWRELWIAPIHSHSETRTTHTRRNTNTTTHTDTTHKTQDKTKQDKTRHGKITTPNKIIYHPHPRTAYAQRFLTILITNTVLWYGLGDGGMSWLCVRGFQEYLVFSSYFFFLLLNDNLNSHWAYQSDLMGVMCGRSSV